jgi:hypothetical protein
VNAATAPQHLPIVAAVTTAVDRVFSARLMTGTVLLMALALAEPTMAAAPVTEPSPPWRGLVVVLVPPIDDDVTRNALARVSGELAAAPFRTITRPIDPDREVMAQVETAGSELSATAAFALVRVRDPGSGRVTIWVSNRISGTTTMQRMQVEGGDVDRAAARLAVETVELVRASMAGLWPSPTVATPSLEGTAPPARVPRLALAVGVGYIRELGDAPSTWAPQIALWYVRPGGLGVRLSASGFGSGAEASGTMGRIRVETAMATVGLVQWFRSERIVQPMIAVAAGVHHLNVHGTPSSRTQDAYDPSAFSALATASVGVAFALVPRLAIVAEADAMFVFPDSQVRVGGASGEIVATFGGPSLFTHAGLLATF